MNRCSTLSIYMMTYLNTPQYCVGTNFSTNLVILPNLGLSVYGGIYVLPDIFL